MSLAAATSIRLFAQRRALSRPCTYDPAVAAKMTGLEIKKSTVELRYMYTIQVQYSEQYL